MGNERGAQLSLTAATGATVVGSADAMSRCRSFSASPRSAAGAHAPCPTVLRHRGCARPGVGRGQGGGEIRPRAVSGGRVQLPVHGRSLCGERTRPMRDVPAQGH